MPNNLHGFLSQAPVNRLGVDGPLVESYNPRACKKAVLSLVKQPNVRCGDARVANASLGYVISTRIGHYIR